MSVVTLTLTDENLDVGTFTSELDVEGSHIDDGFMTAAHLTGVFLARFINTEEFQRRVIAFAEEIAASPGCSIGNAEHLPGNDTGRIAAA